MLPYGLLAGRRRRNARRNSMSSACGPPSRLMKPKCRFVAESAFFCCLISIAPGVTRCRAEGASMQDELTSLRMILERHKVSQATDILEQWSASADNALKFLVNAWIHKVRLLCLHAHLGKTNLN